MSTLWTPQGEVPVGKQPKRNITQDTSATEHTEGAQSTNMSQHARASQSTSASQHIQDAQPADPLAEAQSFNLDNLSPEEREKAEEAIRNLAETRQRLLEVPAATVVANHAMGLYELAALHLAAQPPNFPESSLAIDAMSALVDGMSGRLGEAERTLREGLNQIRIAFVKLKQTLAQTEAQNPTQT